MITFAKKRFLTLALLIFAILYQAGNVYSLVGAFSDHGNYCKRSLAIFGVTLNIHKPCSELGSADYAAGWLRSVGYIGRYLIGHQSQLLVRGKNYPAGWLCLFRRSEMTAHTTAEENYTRNELAPRIKALSHFLSSLEINIINIPLPPKSGLERSLLPDKLPPAEIFAEASSTAENDPYLAYRAVVEADPSHTIDLYTAYKQEMTLVPDDPMYIPWGYHWTSKGMAVAVEQVLLKLKENGTQISDIHLTKESIQSSYTPERLLKTLMLPDYFIRSRPEFSWREPIYTVHATLPEPRPNRIIFIADSNGARLQQEKRGIAGLLGNVFQRPTFEFTPAGRGGVGSLLYMLDNGFELHRNDLVVFEFQIPSRFSQEQLNSVLSRVAGNPLP